MIAIKSFLRIFLLFLVPCIIAVAGIPFIDKALSPTNTQPSIITFMGIGGILILFTGGIVYFGLRAQISLPKKFLLFTFLYNTFIILAKFTLAPWIFYKANLYSTFESSLGILTPSGNADLLLLFFASSMIFICYFLVFFCLYVYCKRKVHTIINEKPSIKKKYSIKLTQRKIVLTFGFFLLITTLVMTGTYMYALILLYISVGPALSYVAYLLSIPESIFIAVALLGAILFATKAFTTITQQAIFIKKASLVALFFWIGLSFLLLYHGLWIVYFLIITAIWPLKVIVPK